MPPTPSIQLVTAAVPYPKYRLLELPDEIAALLTKEDGSDAAAAAAGAKRNPDDSSDDDEAGPSDAARRKRIKRLTIKGRRNDEAVLCTDSATYALREMVQSNSLLLCSVKGKQRHEPPSLVLQSNVAEVLELSRITPRLERIVALLTPSSYCGEDEESVRLSRRLYTPKELRSIVQASRAELDKALDERHVLLLDGHCRLVPPSYLATVLLALLNFVDLHSYLVAQVPLQGARAWLVDDHDVRGEVADAVLTRWFGAEKDEVVELDGTGIVRLLGMQVLCGAQQPVPLETVMTQWRKAAGEALASQVDLDVVKGNYLLHPAPHIPSIHPPRIQHFPKASLPIDAPARFQELFSARPQWLLEDLRPYLEDIAVDRKRLDALLVKFCRTSKVRVADGPAAAKKPLKPGEGKEVTLYTARIKS